MAPPVGVKPKLAKRSKTKKSPNLRVPQEHVKEALASASYEFTKSVHPKPSKLAKDIVPAVKKADDQKTAEAAGSSQPSTSQKGPPIKPVVKKPYLVPPTKKPDAAEASPKPQATRYVESRPSPSGTSVIGKKKKARPVSTTTEGVPQGWQKIWHPPVPGKESAGSATLISPWGMKYQTRDELESFFHLFDISEYNVEDFDFSIPSGVHEQDRGEIQPKPRDSGRGEMSVSIALKPKPGTSKSSATAKPPSPKRVTESRLIVARKSTPSVNSSKKRVAESDDDPPQRCKVARFSTPVDLEPKMIPTASVTPITSSSEKPRVVSKPASVFTEFLKPAPAQKPQRATVEKQRPAAVQELKPDAREKQKPEQAAVEKQKPEQAAVEKQKPKQAAVEKQKPKQDAVEKQRPVAVQEPKPDAREKQKPEQAAVEKQKQKPKQDAVEKQKPKQAAVEMKKPAAVQEPKQATVEKPKPATVEKPKPATVEKPKPATVEKPKPATVEKPKPATVEKPKPAAVQKPTQAVVEKPKPAVVEKSKSTSSQEPKQAAVEKPKPASGEKQRPASVEKQRPASVEKQRPAPVEKQRPAPVEKQRPAYVEKQRPASVEKQKPASVEKQKPASVEKQKPASIGTRKQAAAQKLAAVSVENPKQVAVQKPKLDAVEKLKQVAVEKLKPDSVQTPKPGAVQKPKLSSTEKQKPPPFGTPEVRAVEEPEPSPVTMPKPETPVTGSKSGPVFGDIAPERAALIVRLFRPHEVKYQTSEGVPPTFIKVLIKRHVGSLQESVCVVSPDEQRLWNRSDADKYIARRGLKAISGADFNFSKFLDGEDGLSDDEKVAEFKKPTPVRGLPSKPSSPKNTQPAEQVATPKAPATPKRRRAKKVVPEERKWTPSVRDKDFDQDFVPEYTFEAHGEVVNKKLEPNDWVGCAYFENKQDDDVVAYFRKDGLPAGWSKYVLRRMSGPMSGAFGVYFRSPEGFRFWDEREIAGHFKDRDPDQDLSVFAFCVPELKMSTVYWDESFRFKPPNSGVEEAAVEDDATPAPPPMPSLGPSANNGTDESHQARGSQTQTRKKQVAAVKPAPIRRIKSDGQIASEKTRSTIPPGEGMKKGVRVP